MSVINSYCGVAAIVRTFLMTVGLGMTMVRLMRLMVGHVWLIMRHFAILQGVSGLKFKCQ